MKQIAFLGQPYKATEADLIQIEQALGSKLPEDYRDFLLTKSGGQIAEPTNFYRLSDLRARHVFGEGFLVERLFPIRDKDYPEEELMANVRTYKGRIPPETLPIGRNAFGDLLILGFKGAVLNQVSAWDHE